MEDYEYYHVDPYYPLDPDREIETVREVLAAFSPAYQKAAEGLSRLFHPIAQVTHPGCMLPLEVAVIGNIPLFHCKTYNDLNQTLLRDPNTARVK